jgi:nicotinate-nucleotide pyrophosphorylase
MFPSHDQVVVEVVELVDLQVMVEEQVEQVVLENINLQQLLTHPVL